MEIIGIVVILIIGLVLVLAGGSDLISQITWGKTSNRRALIIIIPCFIIGIALIYSSLSSLISIW